METKDETLAQALTRFDQSLSISHVIPRSTLRVEIRPGDSSEESIQQNYCHSPCHCPCNAKAPNSNPEAYTMSDFKGDSELSEFEKQRLANIAERDALLKKLTLEAQSAGLFTKPPKPSDSNKSQQKKKSGPKKPKKEPDTPVVRRMSSRLRGLAADSEIAKRKAEEAAEEAREQEREKRMRRSDTFTLDNMFVSGQKLSGDALLGVDTLVKGVAKPYERTFGEEDVKKTTDKELKALREEMSGLKLWEAWEPNRMIFRTFVHTNRD